MAIGELSVNVTARTAKANKNVRSFRKEIGRVRKPVDAASASLKRLGASLAVAAAANFTVRRFGQIADSIDRIGKVSSKLGIATDKLAGLRHAAEQTGVSANTLDMSLQRMTRRVAEAAQGSGEAKDAIRELGLNAQRLASMTPDEQMLKFADSLNRVTRQSDKVRLSMKLFDSEGVDLVNTLALGSKGLQEMQREAKQLGIALSKDAVKGVENMNDALDRLRKAGGGLGREIVTIAAPAVEGAASFATNTLKARSGNSYNFGFNEQGRRLSEKLEEKRAGQQRRTELVQSPFKAMSAGLGSLGQSLSRFDSLVADTRKDYLKNAPRGLDATGKPLAIKRPKAPRAPALDLKTNASNLLVMNQGLKAIGGLFAGASNLGMAGLIGAKNQALNIAGDLDFGGRHGINRAVDAKSTEGFAALRANQRGGTQTVQKETAKVGERVGKSNTLLAQILAAVKSTPTISIPSA